MVVELILVVFLLFVVIGNLHIANDHLAAIRKACEGAQRTDPEEA
jgi:hypothetical protein